MSILSNGNDASAAQLDLAHGVEDRWGYLRSLEFIRAFVAPTARHLAGAVLDLGCGEALLAEYADSYVGVDGSREALGKAWQRIKEGPSMFTATLVLGRLEDPPVWGTFDTLMLANVLEVLVAAEERVGYIKRMAERFKAWKLVVLDLDRLDEAPLRAAFGNPIHRELLFADGPADVPEVKRLRKLLVWEV